MSLSINYVSSLVLPKGENDPSSVIFTMRGAVNGVPFDAKKEAYRDGYVEIDGRSHRFSADADQPTRDRLDDVGKRRIWLVRGVLRVLLGLVDAVIDDE